MNPQSWTTQLAGYPYARPLMIIWQIADRSQDPHWQEYETALSTYLEAQGPECGQERRTQLLTEAKSQFERLASLGDGHIGTRLALIRLNVELEDHPAAVTAVERLLQVMPWLSDPLPDDVTIQINRPFLAPIPEYDLLEAQEGLGQWLQAAISTARDQLGKC